ncbi:tetratricopeptide repeat protein [Moraxella canis]|uniref:tetratricopeptide repeat protein n=1 Tax=Moraxella canis TaxID=90239 RepID=UPI000A8D8344|nr:tetratricopeptide repeat protein [Moraxella canis]
MKIRVKWLMIVVTGAVLSACQSTPPPPKNNPQLAQIRTQIAVSLLDMGQLDQAKQQLDAAMSADRQFAPAYRTLAKVYQASEDAAHQAKARRLFEHAIKLNPEDMQSHMDYGLYLVQMGDLSGALTYFDKPSRAIGYEGRVIAIENMAYIYYHQYQAAKLPTEDMYHNAKSALERALASGTQNGEIKKSYDKLLSDHN